MAHKNFTLDIFIHMDAVGRNDWTGPADERPLTDLGVNQAEHLAGTLTKDAVHGLYSSEARRCIESLAPFSAKTGLPVTVAPGFIDTRGYKAPAGWENAERPGPDPLGGALAAGSAFAALQDIEEALPEGGRAILCSYGDVVPALLAFLSGRSNTSMPPKTNAKGAVYRVSMQEGKASLSLTEPDASFPQ